MELLTEILTQKVSAAFEQCGYGREFGLTSVSDRPDLCQFQCNGAFSAAKAYKMPPLAIAAQVAEVLKKDVAFSGAAAAGGGFINLSVKDDFLISYVGEVLSDPFLGIPQAKTQETVVLDYGGPNVAKPLHIGHLRSAIIGEALKRIVKATGRTAIGDVHLGDWGLPVGLVLALLCERNPDWEAAARTGPHALPEINAAELNEIYPAASKRSGEDPQFKQKAQHITALLQKGHPFYTALWGKVVAASVSDIKSNYDSLNVTFDYWYGESDAEKYVPELIKTLKKKGLLQKSDGALIVDVAEDGDSMPIPPVIVKKADDANIYATTDLATVIQRVKMFRPQQIWYVVDSRQSLHFIQVFRCAKKAGFAENIKLEHLGFGTVNGKDGKPYKTRDGGVMRLSELYDTVFQAVSDKVAASDFNEGRAVDETARKIAVAALKFGDLINHRSKDYVFDLDRFLASEGKTGAFLLYTIARINSILNKIQMPGDQICFGGQVYSEIERELLLKIALGGSVFVGAFEERAPNHICENAFQLASVFSRFYGSSHILSETDRDKMNFRIALCAAVKRVLQKHLDVLGIEAVEFM